LCWPSGALAEWRPGEVELSDAQPHPATVTIDEQTEELERDASARASVLIQFLDASSTLMRGLSRRIRGTVEMVAQMAHKSVN
jgi:hypothetical protein